MFWQHSQTESTFCRAKALYIHMKHFLIVAALVSVTAWAQVPVHISVDSHARAHLPRVPRVKLLRSNPHRFTAIRFQGTNPYDAPDDDYICSGSARRPKVTPPTDSVDDDVSDYVAVRLAVARARAMARYRELHA
jgi:hypothetical protein